uniref:Replication protein A 70 kDa DNA-binding subunit B/D first OB fold domain-containing protein n=1 Tax=Brassica oleracea var. oleracea TaxID=109376 RepID=A0A0D3BUZ3_BRAOL
MTHYNKLSKVSYNPKITSWRFRVKIHRIYPFYSYVTSSGPFYKYVLADEEGTKMEMTIDGNSDRFLGLEKQEGKWVEIFRVEVNRSYPGFQETNSRFNLSATHNTQVYIIDPLNNQLFMDFKNIHAIPHMDHMDRNYPIDTMGVVFNTEAHFDDPASPRMVFYIRDNM